MRFNGVILDNRWLIVIQCVAHGTVYYISRVAENVVHIITNCVGMVASLRIRCTCHWRHVFLIKTVYICLCVWRALIDRLKAPSSVIC